MEDPNETPKFSGKRHFLRLRKLLRSNSIQLATLSSCSVMKTFARKIFGNSRVKAVNFAIKRSTIIASPRTMPASRRIKLRADEMVASSYFRRQARNKRIMNPGKPISEEAKLVSEPCLFNLQIRPLEPSRLHSIRLNLSIHKPLLYPYTRCSINAHTPAKLREKRSCAFTRVLSKALEHRTMDCRICFRWGMNGLEFY